MMEDTRREIGSIEVGDMPVVYQRDNGDFYKVSPMGTGRKLGIFRQVFQMPTHRHPLPASWFTA